ncbi:hypothetical protein DICVIV_00988 [Dictyocaulus viviparus]|uniref:Uncharacterized protein n=1 Tax=Dictyocaulus viviparus TaxID=29172 RepID=A0A0D8YDU8_DICVI|nr:hypothetical protein DICVIV_00988 [Dictyocaulus viviparus]
MQQQREEPTQQQSPLVTPHPSKAGQAVTSKEEDEHPSNQTTASGPDELHVDTLNGLAQALQKVINPDQREPTPFSLSEHHGRITPPYHFASTSQETPQPITTTSSLPPVSVAASLEDEPPSPEQTMGVLETNGGATVSHFLPSHTVPDLTQRIRTVDNLATFENLESALSCTLGTSSVRPNFARDDSSHRDDASSTFGSSAIFHVGTPPLFSPVPTSESDFEFQVEDEDEDDPEILGLIQKHRMQQLQLREQQRIELEELRTRQRQMRLARATTVAPTRSSGDSLPDTHRNSQQNVRYQPSTVSLPASPPPPLITNANDRLSPRRFDCVSLANQLQTIRDSSPTTAAFGSTTTGGDSSQAVQSLDSSHSDRLKDNSSTLHPQI